MVGMSKESYGESGNRIVSPSVDDRCKNFDTFAIPYITINLKADLIFRNVFVLL